MVKTVTARGVLITAFTLATTVAVPAALLGQDDAVKKGQQVYTAQKCQSCHSIAGKGSKKSPLDGVGAKLSADEIREWIVHPKVMTAKAKSTKKPPMPDKYSKLPAADIDALVAYMQSLK
jgi:mono/diheme cytochrome c family protein